MFTEDADSELSRDAGEDQVGQKSSKFKMLMLLGGVGLPAVLFSLYFFELVGGGNAEVKQHVPSKNVTQKNASLANGKQVPTKSRGLSAKAKPSLAGKRELLMGLAAIGILAIFALAFTTLSVKEEAVTDLDKPVVDLDKPVVDLEKTIVDLKKNGSIPVQEPSSVDRPSSYGWWILTAVSVVLGLIFIAAITKNKFFPKEWKYHFSDNAVVHTIQLPIDSTVGDLRAAIKKLDSTIRDCLVGYEGYDRIPYYIILNQSGCPQSGFSITKIDEYCEIWANVQFLDMVIEKTIADVTLEEFIISIFLDVKKVTINQKEHSKKDLRILHLLDAHHPITLDASGYNLQEYVFFARNYYGFYAYKIPEGLPAYVTFQNIFSAQDNEHLDIKLLVFCNANIGDFILKTKDQKVIDWNESVLNYRGQVVLLSMN